MHACFVMHVACPSQLNVMPAATSCGSTLWDVKGSEWPQRHLAFHPASTSSEQSPKSQTVQYCKKKSVSHTFVDERLYCVYVYTQFNLSLGEQS